MTDTDLKALSEAATQGEWTPHNMVHAEGRPMTPEEIGEYITNSVKMSDETRFFFVSGNDGGNDVDICHTGNGPRGPHNTALICALKNGFDAGTLIPATEVEGWQPIETAPDTHAVILWSKRSGAQIQNWGHFKIHNHPQFTHWMPLVQPPVEAPNELP